MNSAKSQWQDILKKNMSRKQFIGFLGIAALAVFNAEALLQFRKSKDRIPVNDGYSSNGYSGFVGLRPAPGTKTKGFD